MHSLSIRMALKDLSKSMDGVSMAHGTEMYIVINFVLENEDIRVKDGSNCPGWYLEVGSTEQ